MNKPVTLLKQNLRTQRSPFQCCSKYSQTDEKLLNPPHSRFLLEIKCRQTTEADYYYNSLNL